MGDGTALFNGSFSTTDPFRQAHPALQGLICRDIDQIRTRHSVLRDQDRLAVALERRQQIRGPALVGRDWFLLELAELADGQDQPDDQQHKDDEAPEHKIDSHHCFLASRAASLK
jgi:hypothetical protein